MSHLAASLPQRMTNEDLALSLLNIFRPFGSVTSVKASRDPKGRPFGFVEFSSSAAATSALAYAACLTLDSRRIRVEPARRQRKLCIKQRLSGSMTVERALEGMRKALGRWVQEGDFKLSVQGGEETERWLGEHREAEQVVAAIVKFEAPERAKQAYSQWRMEHPEWSLFWINLDRTAVGSNVRNSGLVQLVPAPDGSVFPGGVNRLSPGYAFLNYPLSRYASLSPPPPPPSTLFTNPSYSQSQSNAQSQSQSQSTAHTPAHHHAHVHVHAHNSTTNGGVGLALYSPPSPPLPMLPPRFTPHYEEASYETSDLARELGKLHLGEEDPKRASDEIDVEEWLGSTLFVGRLNGQSVTLALLHSHFTPHGRILHIRLYNRGAVGLDGVPLDAYAFIRFEEDAAVVAAIEGEHGRAWLGQAIKCEPARKGPLTAMLRRSDEDATSSEGEMIRGISPPMSPVGGFALYYPTVMTPVLSTSPPAVQTPKPSTDAKSNWFRATKPRVSSTSEN